MRDSFLVAEIPEFEPCPFSN